MKKPVAALLCSLAALPVFAETPRQWTEPATGMNFVAIAKGCFKMGTGKPVLTKGDLHWRHLGFNVGFEKSLSPDEIPRHEVCVDAFWLGQHEVRWRDWQRVMGGEIPAGQEDAPVVGIDWHQAREYAEKLTARDGGQTLFRLPTEAEWEYACRAGNDAEESVSYTQEMIGLAWHNNAGLRLFEPKPVGELPPNKFGLHDMLGNVWEWVEDAYAAGAYAKHALYNPVQRPARNDDAQRVIRGGSFRSEPMQMRCANRGRYAATASLPQLGFRLVRIPKETP